MNKDLEAVRRLAKDLTKEAPRDPEEQLAGFPLTARCLDKCRATLVGLQGDYSYGCPMDRRFLDGVGIGVNEFKQFVATGAADAEVAQWIQEHARVST